MNATAFRWLLAALAFFALAAVTTAKVGGEFLVNTVTTNAQSAFNLKVEVASQYATVAPGENVWFSTKFFNLGAIGRQDVTLTYEIRDAAGTVRASKTETVAVQTQASFVGNLEVPHEARDGTYRIVSRVTTLEVPAQSQEAVAEFNVKTKSAANDAILYVGAAGVAVLALGIAGAPAAARAWEKRKLNSKIRGIVARRLK